LGDAVAGDRDALGDGLVTLPEAEGLIAERGAAAAGEPAHPPTANAAASNPAAPMGMTERRRLKTIARNRTSPDIHGRSRCVAAFQERLSICGVSVGVPR